MKTNKMNNCKRLFQQQYGIAKWNSYDDTMKRFLCSRNERYTQLFYTHDEEMYDTPIFACKFSQQRGRESLLALANEDGKLAVHNTARDRLTYGIRAHNNAIFDLAWMFDNMKLVTASGDHTTKLFDVSEGAIRPIATFYGHTRSVKTVAFRKEDPCVFASGGRDGNIFVWDSRTQGGRMGKADRQIMNSHITTPRIISNKKKCNCLVVRTSNVKSVTGLVFQDDNTLISCGGGDGMIKIWDLRKNYLFHKSEPLPKSKIEYGGNTTKNGFSCLHLDKDGVKLYANCLDNSIYCYNVGTCNPAPLMKYVGHHNSTFYIKSCLSNDGLYLVSGSSDENAYIWNTTRSKPLVKLTGHTAEVTCVAWSDEEDLVVVTCSDDMSHRIWRLGPEELPRGWQGLDLDKAEALEAKKPCKRAREETKFKSKKLLMSCQRCRQPSASELCQGCKAGKRKNPDEVSNDCKRVNTNPSPRALQSLDNVRQAPTLNLPNFVIDGVAPHLHISPPKQKQQDWLTKFRIERQFKRDFVDGASTSAPSPKMPKLDVTPKKGGKVQSPLLRFFKVKCDGHSHLNKNSPGSCVLTSGPTSSQ